MYISIFGYYVRTIVNWIEMARAAQSFFLRLTDKLRKVRKLTWNLKALIKLLNQGTQFDEVRSFQFFIMKFGKLFRQFVRKHFEFFRKIFEKSIILLSNVFLFTKQITSKTIS